MLNAIFIHLVLHILQKSFSNKLKLGTGKVNFVANKKFSKSSVKSNFSFKSQSVLHASVPRRSKLW